MREESLVIVNQHVTVNWLQNSVHTARHVLEINMLKIKKLVYLF